MRFDIDELRGTLQFEYKEFFKTRKKIKADISKEAVQVKEKIDSFEKLLPQLQQDTKIALKALDLLIETKQID